MIVNLKREPRYLLVCGMKDSVAQNRVSADRSPSLQSRSDHKGSHVVSRSSEELPDFVQSDVNFIATLQVENPSQEAVP